MLSWALPSKHSAVLDQGSCCTRDWHVCELRDGHSIHHHTSMQVYILYVCMYIRTFSFISLNSGVVSMSMLFRRLDNVLHNTNDSCLDAVDWSMNLRVYMCTYVYVHTYVYRYDTYVHTYMPYIHIHMYASVYMLCTYVCCMYLDSTQVHCSCFKAEPLKV